MKHSLSYYLTLKVLKLKGVKKKFTFDPIDFNGLRKEDVLYPKGRFFTKRPVKKFKISDSNITEIGQSEHSEEILIFIHGGAFVSGPGQHHWDSIQEISKRTKQTIWMCNYPKAPENTITSISENIDAVYSAALKDFKSSRITLIGDSVGGTLVTCLTQRLIQRQDELPNKIILVCPVMDSSMTNPEIDQVDQLDPVLSKAGVLSAKKMCAGGMDLKNEMISPLYGSFEQFPKTVVFLAENDITYPDQKLAMNKMKLANVELRTIVGENMPHIWPFLPVMREAREALKQIIELLNE